MAALRSMSSPASGAPLADGVRVIEIGESIASALVGMVLADHGADVLMVEPPGGSRLRQLPAFAMWARGKQSITLDLTESAARAALRDLTGKADVVVTGLEPATADRFGVDGLGLTASNPRLVHCEITGFGRGHPLSDVAGHEGVVVARGGRAHEFSVLFEGTRPAFPAVPIATYGAAMLGLQGVFAALIEREQTGVGQAISTSLLRAMAVYDLSGWTPGADRSLRMADVPMVFYFVGRTSDGIWVQFSQNAPRLFLALLRALDLEHLLEQERFRTAPHLADADDARALRALLIERFGQRSWDDWRAVFRGDPDISAEPFTWPGDALAHPQLRHTGDARDVADPHLGPTVQLGPLATFSATPAVGIRPAPQAGPATAPKTWGGATVVDTAPARPAPALLQGVTVLEMATWIATPMATALLAELGARVIKIEPLEGDPLRRYGPTGLKCVQGKESITLDMKTDAGREIVHRLATRADVLTHNYRPGVPERLGIDAETLRALNPRLIHLYAASYGSTGPMSPLPAFHVTAGAVCGGVLEQCGSGGAPGPGVELSPDELAWWSSRLLRANESHPDFNAALAVAAAVTMALFAVRRTGLGQAVETRMMASNAYALSEYFIDYPRRPARRFADAGIHGPHALYRLYETRDGWVFLATPGDRDFARLCDALGSPEVATDHRFRDAERRRANDDHLVQLLAARFLQRDASSWQRELTEHGVACVQVNDAPHAAYIFDAPWASELGFVATSAESGLGPYLRYGRSLQTARDVGPLGAADVAGAQSRRILAEIGYTAHDVESLIAAGVVGAPPIRA
jgi:crotonobetainyl-CoA:carnitine CoA-transferase CaiB-like acyl-CoA transferase